MRSAVRRLARVLPSAMLGAALALTAVAPAAKAAPADAEPTPWAAGDKTVVVDEPTITTWEGVAKDDTANVGRIWTDKSVFNEDVELLGGIESVIKKDDSDFLVGLSALSSTSNTITTTTSVQPLDIVLVLDVSGSMRDDITSTTYEPAYSINEGRTPTYYALQGDRYVAIVPKFNTTYFPFRQEFDHWELNGKTVSPKKSADDPEGIQFYTQKITRTAKIDALKAAANGFIEATAEKNAGIADASKQHRISIVKFAGDNNDSIGNDTYRDGYNYSQIVTDLKAYDRTTVSGATAEINKINAGGATAADRGMAHAKAVLEGREASGSQDALGGARQDAKRVVIFFTDGEPNHQSGFDAEVANSAIRTSEALKNGGATVYSIGVFAEADPADTSKNFNAYMHGVSSNYPDASSYRTLGARAENSDYYKAATDADELNSIFQEISNEINSGTGTPTETIDGMANKSGYITFTDELGAYMQVDGFKTLIFADKEFSLRSKTTDGLVDTYAYEGTGGNALYPDGNVKDIVVQVKRSNDLAKGDIVTVKIPASLIPLRNFKVESNDGAANMGIDEAYPLRIFYGVSIKPGVRNAVLSGTADDALRAYIKNNSDEGGKTAFYSNLYDGANVEGNKLLGNTTATFVPSKVNSFYYFTEDTTLYTDDACANPLREKPESGKTYYYKRAHYKQNADGKTATKDWAITQFKGANFDALTTYWGKAPDGTYFIKAGSPRLTRIDALTLGKKENLTGTATEVINPRWDNINNPYEINVNLGNNGKLSVEMPGTLSITKDARITPGKNIDPSVLEGKQFKFEISIPSAAGKTLKADVKNAQGEVVSEAFDMVFNKDGKREQTLKDNETLTIYGLDANTAYTVTEKEIPAGFTQTNATDNKGTITANEVAHAKFENTYDVAAKPIASDDFVKYQKFFDKWEVAEAFDIQLHAVQAGNPMPKGSIYGPDNRGVKIAPATQQYPTGSFGNIVFDRPGTFEYTVSEVKPAGDTMVPGVTYSQAVYKVTVVVEDNGDGTLTVASNTMTKVSNDAGGNLAAPEEISNKTAVFVNKFNAKSTSAAPVAYKRYTNHGGEGTALKSDMFTFKVESKTPGAPLPEDADPDGDGVLFVKNQGEEIPLAQATFGDEHVGYTYAYDISEVIPRGATAENNFTANGMTYDPTVYRAKFQVTFDGVGDQARVEVAISYYKVDGDKEEPLPEGQTPEFNNSYDPADVTLPSDPNDAPLRARKTLLGRDSKQGESFTFELSAADNPTAFALENGVVVFDGPAGATTMTASVSDLKNGQAEDAPFGNVTFTKPGTYKFNIKENAPADGAGMTYDRTTHEVKVVVTDVDGVLKADVKYTGSVKDAAAFTNTYKAEHTFGTGFKLDVTKTLNGRAQEAGEFGFKIEGVDSGTVTAAEASKRLDASEAKFETVAPANSGVPSLMENKLNKLHFTQADAGKTFSYVLREDIPADDKKLGGVTYDKTTYRIDVQVVDNADGTMGTVTTVIKNVPGAASETVGTYDSADGKDAVTLGFTNTYAAQPVKVDGTKYDLNLYKVLEGRDWREGDTFHFVMKAGSHDDPGVQKAEVDVTADPGTKAGEKVPFNFGGYTFTQPGEYYYTITEVEPAEGAKIPGITYSKNAADIVVNVTDNLKGQLEAEVQVYNDTFTNTYKAELDHNAAGGLVIAKTTNGHDMVQGQFKFQVETLDGKGTKAAETAKRLGMEDGKTTGEFGNVAGKDGERVAMTSQTPLKFTQADAGKSFKFKVSEMGADGNPGAGGTKDGYTYSDAVYTVELSVVDNLDGTLTLTTKVTDKDNKTTTTESAAAKPATTMIEFVNTYSAAVPQDSPATTANLFSKVLTGRDWKKDDSFNFTITPLNNAPAPEHSEATLTGLTTAAGAPVEFGFGTINFTFDHIKDAPVVNGERTKTFVYEVSETKGSIPGVAYDAHVATLTVTLKDNGKGVLSATTVVSDGAQFTNDYTTEPVNPDGDGATRKDGIQIVKTLTGRPIVAGDFEFTMAPANEATKAKFGDAKVIKTSAADLGKGDAANTAVATTPVKTGLEFTLEDVGKTYKFELSETKGGGTGYVNDQTKHTLMFTTADNGNGTLSVTVTLDGKEAAVWTSGAELAPVSIGFTNSYSAGSITVGGQGGVALTGTKRLMGRPMVAGEFRFNVTNAKDQTKPTAVVATGTNAADGTITFTGIEYTTEKLNNDVAAGLAIVDRTGNSGDAYTYEYNVSEDATRNDKGISIIQGEQVVTVKVTDNRAGKLSAEVVYPEGGMVFKNAYGTGADGTKVIALNGTKVLDVKSGNKVPDIAGKFTFTLTGSEGAPMPATTTATNDAAGNISFGEITYTMENVFGAPVAKTEKPAIVEGKADDAEAEAGGTADAAKAADASGAQSDEADAEAGDRAAADAEAEPAEGESVAKAAAADEPMVASAPRSKTFTYKVTERGNVAGVANDPEATKTITVKVTDNGDGTLDVDKQVESTETDFTFTNTYSVKPFDSTLTGKGGFAITKTLDGRDLREGEFEFALVSQAEGTPEGVTAKNDASGKVAFPAISFNAPGEYHYRLAEVDGGLGGVTYDTTVYDVTAKVVDNGGGTLGVTWSVSKDGKALEGKEIVFANSYKAAGTSITFNAAKVLTGRELKKGEFTFELRDANGKVLQTVKNGALTEGGYAPIAFDPITYDEPGTYDYRIVEVKGDAEGITYDETVFTYHVVVTDDGNGQLQVEWTVGETGAPVFQNVFVKPEDPKPADPAKPADPGNGGSGDKLIQTGDNALVGMFAAAFAGIAAIGVGFTARRKKK